MKTARIRISAIAKNMELMMRAGRRYGLVFQLWEVSGDDCVVFLCFFSFFIASFLRKVKSGGWGMENGSGKSLWERTGQNP